ncbi:MAG: hypothetical protein LiPW41_317 [Parcubacteria group bacterium LiPW_41]|nr:MAG: hypothetical protein LiPW41_317 [Parcubacteria group bacterium LiPW_41]
MKKVSIFLVAILISSLFTGCFKESKKVSHSKQVENTISKFDFAKRGNKWYPVRNVLREGKEINIEICLDPYGSNKLFVFEISEFDSVIQRGYDSQKWQKLATEYIESRNF